MGHPIACMTKAGGLVVDPSPAPAGSREAGLRGYRRSRGRLRRRHLRQRTSPPNFPVLAYRRAENLARLIGRDLPAVLIDTIAMSPSLLNSDEPLSPPLADASSEEVLALAALEMDPTQDQRLSTRLDRQQAGELDLEERVELVALMQVYEEGLLRKAQALAESVRRGLRERLTP